MNPNCYPEWWDDVAGKVLDKAEVGFVEKVHLDCLIPPIQKSFFSSNKSN